MLKNYFLIALRNIKKDRLYSFINIAGLATGMTAGILIFILVRYDLSFDKFHPDQEDIYRIVRHGRGNDWRTSTAPVLAPTLLREFPDIDKIARFRTEGDHIRFKNQTFSVSGFAFVDSAFLDIFSFPLSTGDKHSMLKEPFTVLITNKVKAKYFPKVNPIGKYINLYHRGKYRKYKITGVLKELPKNTHLDFNFLASFESFKLSVTNRKYFINLGNNCLNTYVKLKKYSKPDELEAKLKDYTYSVNDNSRTFHIQPVSNIHFEGVVLGGKDAGKDLNKVYMLVLIGIFIIGIACFNYMNLSTARYKKRSKEVGMRKVVGACRNEIIIQFLVESTMMSLSASFISFIFLAIFLGPFGILMDRSIDFFVLLNPMFMAFLILFATFIGVLSGSYPAFFLSSLKPSRIFKGSFAFGEKKQYFLRNLLVSVQFVISIVLIISILISYSQLDYVKTKDPGFKKDNILVVYIGEEFKNNYNIFKNKLLENPDIIGASISDGTPVKLRWHDKPSWSGSVLADTPEFSSMYVDKDFIDLYQLKMISGRKFSQKMFNKTQVDWILNESAAKLLGSDDPIDRNFRMWSLEGKVVGVVKNFHFNSMHKTIGPVAIRFDKPMNDHRFLSVEIREKNMSKTLAFIKKVYNSFSPKQPFNFSFIDQTFDKYYLEEEKLNTAISYFTILAMIITCLGLFGLTSFSSENKKKTIGIKRILGAGVGRIVYSFLKEYLMMFLVANAIAWPIASSHSSCETTNLHNLNSSSSTL